MIKNYLFLIRGIGTVAVAYHHHHHHLHELIVTYYIFQSAFSLD